MYIFFIKLIKFQNVYIFMKKKIVFLDHPMEPLIWIKEFKTVNLKESFMYQILYTLSWFNDEKYISKSFQIIMEHSILC